MVWRQSFRRLAPSLLAALAFAPACDLDKDLGPSEELDAPDELDEPIEIGPLAAVPTIQPCDLPGQVRDCDDGAVQFCDWQTVGDATELIWSECQVDVECMPGDQRECLVDSVWCTLEEGVPYWPQCPFTPLVLSFAGGGVELEPSAASFDLAGVGECLASDWPAPSNPWLALDRDRNGFIDGGHELFGSGTILANGERAKHGFAALAALDHNRDGVLDERDPLFDELLVWRDADGDKLSMRWELTSLRDEGVSSLALDYEVRERCDARGNCARERAPFEFVVAGQRRLGELVDVHLACD